MTLQQFIVKYCEADEKTRALIEVLCGEDQKRKENIIKMLSESMKEEKGG